MNDALDGELPVDHPFNESIFGPAVNSVNRIDWVLALFNDFPDRRAECFAALGKAWISCDNIALRKAKVRRLLNKASRDELDAMMSVNERQTWGSLPDTVEVFRGCYDFNRDGLSWSLDRNVAVKITTLLRYRHPGEERYMIRGHAPKSRIVLKLGREEQEIIAAKVKIDDTFYLGVYVPTE